MSSEAVAKAKDFNPQNIANLLWALATSGVSPNAALVQAMSSEAVAKAKAFNPQDIANLLWALATLGVSPSAALVQAMSSEAVAKAKAFKPQEIANLLWALATSGVSPNAALVQAMSSEAVAKAKDFNPQNIANLLWALATSGMSPDVALVQAMSSEAVAKAKAFNPQNIANLLWALATSGVSPDAMLVRTTLGEISADVNSEHTRQLHQFFLFNSLSPHPADVSLLADFAAHCKAAFVAHSSSSASPSALQKDVARALRKLVDEEVLEEQVLEDSGYSVDMRLVGTRVIVEVDGPSHYLQREGNERVMDGSTKFKVRTLRQLGWTVLQVPYFEWNPLKTQKDQAEFLSALLASAETAVSASAEPDTSQLK
jgi:very-short-patch-repair endonuclease/precorrin-6B methylase 2